MSLTDNLLTLYKVDRHVRSLRSRLESAQIYLDLQKNQLKKIELERDENNQIKKQRKANMSNLETEIGAIDDRIETLREELNRAVNDKQYSALLAEVNTLKARSKAFEDEELVEMAAVELLDQTSATINERAREREKVQKVASKELETRRSEVVDRIAELETERSAAAAVIPEDDLATFDEIADDYDGEAMAAVEIIDVKRREYLCTACSLRLPLDSITTLLGRGDILVKCVSCNRILYIEAETREAIAPSKK